MEAKYKLLRSASGQEYVFDIQNSRIGKGAFGEVYKGNVLVNGELGDVVAIKCVYRDQILKVGEELYKAIGSEVNILQQLVDLKPPHIIRIYDCFESKEYINIILEFCNQGTLKDVLENAGGKLPEEKAVPIFYQVVQAINFLSQQDITHRDLKPENVFIKDGEFKLGDFGFATAKKTLNEFAGTLPYMAPEIVGDEPSYDKQVDVWSLGIILHEMLFGDYPFQGNQIRMTKAILNDPYVIPPSPKISDACKDLLTKCLEKDPKRRITTDQMMQHPLFKHLRPTASSTYLKQSIDMKGSLPVGESLSKSRASIGLQETEINELHKSHQMNQTQRVQKKLFHIHYLCNMLHEGIFAELKKVDKSFIFIRYFVIKFVFKTIFRLYESLKKKELPEVLPQGDLVYWDSFILSSQYQKTLESLEKDKVILASNYDKFYKEEFAVYLKETNPPEALRKLILETYPSNIDIDFGVMFDVKLTEAEKTFRLKINSAKDSIEQRFWTMMYMQIKFFVFAKEALANKIIVDSSKFNTAKDTMSQTSMCQLIETGDFRAYVSGTSTMI